MRRTKSVKLLSSFRTLDGSQVLGLLTAAAPGSTSTNLPLRLLHVPRPCYVVEPGDVIVDLNGNLLLLMETTQGMLDMKSFRAAQVSNTYTWTRMVKTMDPVAKVMRDNAPSDLGLVHAYFENPTEIALEKLVENRYQFYTGEDVQVGDVVGGKSVKKVSQVLGVKLVFAE